MTKPSPKVLTHPCHPRPAGQEPQKKVLELARGSIPLCPLLTVTLPRPHPHPQLAPRPGLSLTVPSSYRHTTDSYSVKRTALQNKDVCPLMSTLAEGRQRSLAGVGRSFRKVISLPTPVFLPFSLSPSSLPPLFAYLLEE